MYSLNKFYPRNMTRRLLSDFQHKQSEILIFPNLIRNTLKSINNLLRKILSRPGIFFVVTFTGFKMFLELERKNSKIGKREMKKNKLNLD